ncbi:MAG: transcription elongation factor GreA [Candidatus Brocadiia bacterium]
MSEAVPMTPDGYTKLVKQLDDLKGRRVRISKAIGEAREKGDLRENAEYHAAREDQGLNEAKIRELEDRLARAHIVRPEKTGAVQFGSKVRLLDLDENIEEDFELVGAGDEDYTRNKILTTSPLGSALIGKNVGDEVCVPVPAGTIKFRILSLE